MKPRSSLPFALLLSMTTAAAGAGFTGDYTVHGGDANADGIMDIYIQPAGYHDIEDTDRFDLRFQGVKAFLLQSSGGTFNIVSFLSRPQVRQFAAWPALPVTLEGGDYNMDDVEDVMIKGLAGQPGYDNDLMVFASSSGNEPPVANAPVTPEFRAFFEQLYLFAVDPDHIVKLGLESRPCNFETQVGTELWGFSETESEYLLRYGAGEYCYRRAKIAGENFQPLGVLAGIATREILLAQSLEAGTRQAVIFSQLLERILGVEMMENVLEEPGNLTESEERLFGR